jgi:thioredoxin reductase (NADPH)
MRDVVILGGGAAGLAAASYALDKQLDVRVIASVMGGKSGWQHHNSPLQPIPPSTGEAVTDLLRLRLTQLPDVLLHDTVLSIAKANGVFQIETMHNGREEAVAVLIATGVTPVALDVPGSKGLLGYGLGYSAATHAQELRGTVAAVVGATKRAMRGVHELARIATMVYWIGPSLTELMSPLGMGLQYRPNVKVFENYRVIKVLGDQRVEAIVIQGPNELKQLAVDGAFVDLGLMPNSALVENLVILDNDGFIPVNEAGATTLPGLFAAGDVTTHFGEQLLVAVGQGTSAAISAYDYVLTHRATHTT